MEIVLYSKLIISERCLKKGYVVVVVDDSREPQIYKVKRMIITLFANYAMDCA